MTNNEQSDARPPIIGRTFWDIVSASSYILGGIIFVLIMGIIIYLYLDEVPSWFFISVFGSLAFIPFLMDRAKEDADLFLVSNGPLNLTEYRIGKRYGLRILGNGVLFNSNSGTYRTVLTSFDEDTRMATGSSFGDYTQIDQVRDMNTLEQLSVLLEDTLRDSRISAQTVGIEVEKQSKVIVDWALKTIYGSIIPSEISDIFGVDIEEKDKSFEHKSIDEIVEDEIYD